MLFCERFRLTPQEYYNLPKSLIDLWVSMSNIREAVEKTKETN